MTDAAPDQRGHTYSEAFRHECEVRYVLALPSKWARRDYLNSLHKWRSPAAVERLRADVAAAWHARRTESPGPPDGEDGPPPLPACAGVNASVNGNHEPVKGSFLHATNAGNSRPIESVVSGVSAR